MKKPRIPISCPPALCVDAMLLSSFGIVNA